MSQKLYPVNANFAAKARITRNQYLQQYAESIGNPDAFWQLAGQRLDWITPYSKIKDVSFRENDFRIRWFYDGQLNVASNCLDRHLGERDHKTAIIWEGDDPSQSRRISYRELYERVCQCANALRELGVRKGDRVTIYLPMIPEIAISMLACARIGAVHSVVFGGFSPDSLAGRIVDCDSSVVITADEGIRGAKKIPLKANVDAALSSKGTECVKHVWW
jgi:acetyl-CoA synthetase